MSRVYRSRNAGRLGFTGWTLAFVGAIPAAVILGSVLLIALFG